MEQEPLISIIIPVYNGEMYLEECLASIYKQTYKNIEVIIINDGSTDSTLSIIQKYTSIDHRFKVISQKNLGLSGARNTGLDLITGQYITMVDADDTLDENFINVMYVLSIETGNEIVACNHTSDIKSLGLSNETYTSVSSNIYMKSTLSQKDFNHSVWGKLYSAKLWDNMRFKSLYYEDLEIFPRLFLKTSSVTVTDAKLYFYRPNANSFINTFSSRRLDVLKSIDSVIDTLNNHECDKGLIEAAYCRKLSALFNMYFITYNRLQYKTLNQQYWNEIVSSRTKILFCPSSSLKLRSGIIASYFGQRFIQLLNSILHISK